MTGFNPLVQIKRITETPGLSHAHFRILIACVLHTDNKTGRVRASQEIIAEHAHVTRDTMWKWTREVRPYWFREVERGRQVNLTWLSTVVADSPAQQTDSPVQRTDSPAQRGPSTSTSTPPSTTPTPKTVEKGEPLGEEPLALKDVDWDEMCEDCRGIPCICNPEPLGIVVMCTLHNWFITDCGCDESIYGKAYNS